MPPEINNLNFIITDNIREDIDENIFQFVQNHSDEETQDLEIGSPEWTPIEPLYFNTHYNEYFREPTRDEIKYIQFRTTRCKLPIVENERKEWFNLIIEEKIKNM